MKYRHNQPFILKKLFSDFYWNTSNDKLLLTFDDGLYSQFYYYDEIKKIDTQKIFFISSNIVCTGKQSLTFPTCREAHEKSFMGNNEDYMSLEQIQFLKIRLDLMQELQLLQD